MNLRRPERCLLLLKYPFKRHLPFIRQPSPNDCGIAALAMVLAHHGIRVSTIELKRSVSSHPHGVTAESLAIGARRFGLKAKGVQVAPENVDVLPRASILHWEGHHYVVWDCFRHQRMEIVDPAIGHRTVSRSDFLTSFTGVALVFERDSEFTPPPETDLPYVGIQSIQFDRWALSKIVAWRLLLVGLIYYAITSALVLITIALGAEAGTPPPWRQWVVGSAVFVILCVSFLQWRATVGFRRTTATLKANQSGLTLTQYAATKMDQATIYSTCALTKYELQFAVTLPTIVTGALCCLGTAAMLLWRDLYFGLQLCVACILLSLLQWRFGQHILRRRTDYFASAAHGFSISHSDIPDLQRLALDDAVAHSVRNFYFEEEVRLMERETSALWRCLAFAACTCVIVYTALYVSRDKHPFVLQVDNLLAFSLLSIQLVLASLSVTITLRSCLDALYARESTVWSALPLSNGIFSPALKQIDTIALDRVDFAYKDGPPVVPPISFTASIGEVVAIVGPEQSGKSTIAGILAAFLEPRSGRMLLDEEPLTRDRVPSYRKSIGIASHQVEEFRGTLQSVLKMRDSLIADADLVTAASLVGVHEEIMSLPLKYATRVSDSWPVNATSRWDQLKIARAIAGSPKVIILDSVTLSMSPEDEFQLINKLRKLKACIILLSTREPIDGCANMVLKLPKEGGTSPGSSLKK